MALGRAKAHAQAQTALCWLLLAHAWAAPMVGAGAGVPMGRGPQGLAAQARQGTSEALSRSGRGPRIARSLSASLDYWQRQQAVRQKFAAQQTASGGASSSSSNIPLAKPIDLGVERQSRQAGIGKSSTSTSTAAVGAGDALPGLAGAQLPNPIDMEYHDGAIMAAPINVYLIWLGTAFTKAQKNLLRTFLASLNPQNNPANTVQKWWNVNALYYDKGGNFVTSTISIKGETSVPTAPELIYNATRGALVLHGEESVLAIVRRQLAAKKLPVDPNGVYGVISDENIFQMGVTGNRDATMCTRYCGWHDAANYPDPSGVDQVSIKYLWVGVATKLCPRSCIPHPISQGRYASPMLDGGIQGVISIFAHELAESASDPTGEAWWSDSTGDENADKCQWSYNNTIPFKNARGQLAVYNVAGINGTKFLVQGNWDFTTGSCSIGRPPRQALLAGTDPAAAQDPGQSQGQTGGPDSSGMASAQTGGAGGTRGGVTAGGSAGGKQSSAFTTAVSGRGRTRQPPSRRPPQRAPPGQASGGPPPPGMANAKAAEALSGPAAGY